MFYLTVLIEDKLCDHSAPTIRASRFFFTAVCARLCSLYDHTVFDTASDIVHDSECDRRVNGYISAIMKFEFGIRSFVQTFVKWKSLTKQADTF